MSKVIVKVTGAGLTRCTSCHTHVHYAEAVESGACPACGEAFELARAPDVGVNLSGIARATRSGALALALLGAAACGTDDGSGQADLDAIDVEIEEVEEAGPSDVYGAPPIRASPPTRDNPHLS